MCVYLSDCKQHTTGNYSYISIVTPWYPSDKDQKRANKHQTPIRTKQRIEKEESLYTNAKSRICCRSKIRRHGIKIIVSSASGSKSHSRQACRTDETHSILGIEDFGRGEVMRIFGDQITKEEERIAKKMLLVGLWCIQTNPSDLTPMIKVIEMLEGNLETVQIPSKPLFCLPTATVPETLEDSHGISSCSKPSKFGRHAYSLSF
ncbi:hypothetical protein YC2023_109683 [Brassica napus]